MIKPLSFMHLQVMSLHKETYGFAQPHTTAILLCSRRRFFLLLSIACILSCNNKQTVSPVVAPSKTKLEALPKGVLNISTPAEAFTALLEGNKRYNNGQFKHIHIKRVSNQQDDEPNPYVAIITCTDFTIPPEILFDLDKNNILLLKTPGNTENEEVMTSLLQAVNSKEIKLVLVLGHSKCQAINNVINNRTAKETATNKSHIQEAITDVSPDGTGKNESTSMQNVKLTVKRLSAKYPVLDSLLKQGTLQVRGAYYNNTSGELFYDNNF